MPLLEIDGPAGRLEALLDEPARERGVGEDGILKTGHDGNVRAAVVLAHPHTEYGGTMHTKVVYRTAKALSRIGCAVLRFNFRGAGASAGAFTNGPGEIDDFRSALDAMASRYPGRPMWAAGMSFGAWIAGTVGAADRRVTTLLAISIPIKHYDFESIARSPKGKFLIHGERDELCTVKEVREFYARAVEPKELVVIDAADHLFDGKAGEVADAIEDLLGDWSQ